MDTATITSAFNLTNPTVGDYVTGTTDLPNGRTATWGGIYHGVRPSQHTGEPIHYFTDGIINTTPQRCHAIPVAQFPVVRPLAEVLAKHVAQVKAAR